MTSTSLNTWTPETTFSWYHQLGFNILRRGSTPRHVAFIMDGNRRFAKKNNTVKSAGHEQGFNKLTECLQWCLDMGIFEVTVYAFSIENFKRSEDEVKTLMNLARNKFKKLIEEWKRLQDLGICVRIIGNLTLLPKDLLILILVAMLLTKDNERACLNIAFSYTGKEEMTNSANLVVYGVRDGKLNTSNVNVKLMDQCLYTYKSMPPELVIRTSGEHRISDFLSWQSAYSYLHIVDVLWPDFSIWNFMCSIFAYQHFASRSKKRFDHHFRLEDEETQIFVDYVQKDRLHTAVSMCECEGKALDWEKLKSFTKQQLYDYYTQHIHEDIENA